jgi:hypothetical protein
MSDRHKLLTAFSNLINQGIIARPDYRCCQECGIAAMYEEREGWADGDPPVGYAFYDEPSAEDITLGFVHLSYGSFLAAGTTPKYDAADQRIGDEVVAALREQGLDTDWTGDPLQRIKVVLPNW